MARQDGSSNDLMKTMGGINPDVDALPYKLKTSDVEAWIQRAFDSLISEIQKNKPDANIPRVDVSLITIRAGSNFAPFILAMSTNALVNGGKKGGKHNAREYSQFNVKDDDPSVNIKPEIYALIRSWLYTKDDVTGMCSLEGRRNLGISRGNSFQIKDLRTPKLVPLGENGTKLVTVLIDPIRIFWMMLRDSDNPNDKKFEVVIDSWKMISKSGDAEFRITRRRRNRKDKGNVNAAIAQAYAKKMRG